MHVRPSCEKVKYVKLWIARIEYSTRANGMYTVLSAVLTKAGVQVNRKMLADVAINDAADLLNLLKLQKAISNIKK